VICSIPLNVVEPSGLLMTPASGVAPGTTVVVPAVDMVIVNRSLAVGSPP